ncbi:MAG: hypothetical protein IV094_09215 [Vitreoscilla sp.]|nr:hypothetical protein [Vitreoscilla sp.]
MSHLITRRLALTVLGTALAGAALADLPDDQRARSASPESLSGSPPTHPGFKLKAASLACTNSMSKAGYLYTVKLLTQGPFTAGFGLQVRLTAVSPSNVVGSWPLPVANLPGIQTTHLPPGGVALVAGQAYKMEVLFGNPSQPWPPFTQMLTAPSCGKVVGPGGPVGKDLNTMPQF